MGAPVVTPELADRIAELRERGWSIGRIAMKLDLKEATVAYHCLKLGAESPDKPYTPSLIERRTYQRAGKLVRAFTPEEDARIVELSQQGLRPYSIAKLVDRAPSSISMRLMLLARIEEGV